MLYIFFIDNAKVALLLDTTKFISLKSIKRIKIIVPVMNSLEPGKD